ncbi:Avr1b-1 avirulence-like protein [Phytophthora sojae]|uniref:RxLR effector protein Avh6 n=1 Tax=Phytophthora sojae (strain P6497) TaxID=1094619 RepID=AVH6_PHYSP|nr:Avr1b-1 avirulence-like protein [Phytophthora sojae]G4ZLE6.1 RecName: Full=RxLR effector protein Avh6; AltName: Full=Avirulence homolog protein 6; AltName: Full=Avirulence protein 1d; Flags: Precursor [Phytophthora sojae strain P6497]AGC92778.1 avirulence RXLR effector protein [Phytophthora sojae]EGZ16228.1 Avr1b-1 avirulence-like protein [Phytophthora sojae]|eukprot:XP_009529977.1 Avr1b-1 avirulence-like protein [Phytophthora sojae]
MRLSSTTFVVLAAVLLASGTAVSKADETGVTNVNAVHSPNVLAGVDKRFLRSHHTEDGEAKLSNYDNEERNGLFGANTLSNMGKDTILRFQMFTKWKANGYLPKKIKDDIPRSLYKAYKIHYRMN